MSSEKQVRARSQRELDHRTWGSSFPWGHENHRRIMNKGFKGNQSLRVMDLILCLGCLEKRVAEIQRPCQWCG